MVICPQLMRFHPYTHSTLQPRGHLSCTCINGKHHTCRDHSRYLWIICIMNQINGRNYQPTQTHPHSRIGSLLKLSHPSTLTGSSGTHTHTHACQNHAHTHSLFCFLFSSHCSLFETFHVNFFVFQLFFLIFDLKGKCDFLSFFFVIDVGQPAKDKTV